MPGPSHHNRLLALIGQRVGIVAFIYIATQYLFSVFNTGARNANFIWPAGSKLSAASAFTTWDASHHLARAVGGDAPSALSNAFYPLWPALIRWGTWLTHPLASAIILANVFTLVGVVLMWRTVAGRLDDQQADASVLLLLAYPAAFYLALPYSEALFFMLSAGFLHELRRDQPWSAAAFGSLLPLVRAPGHFVSIIFAVHLLLQWRRERGSFLRTMAPLSLTALGSVAFFAEEFLRTGDMFTSLTIQKRFISQGGLSKLWHPVESATQFAKGFAIHGRRFATAPHDRVAFVLTVLTLPSLWKLDKTWFTWVVWMGIVPPIINGFMGGMRYELVAWPLFVAMATWFAKPQRQSWLWLTVGGFAMFQALFCTMHALNYWVD